MTARYRRNAVAPGFGAGDAAVVVVIVAAERVAGAVCAAAALRRHRRRRICWRWRCGRSRRTASLATGLVWLRHRRPFLDRGAGSHFHLSMDGCSLRSPNGDTAFHYSRDPDIGRLPSCARRSLAANFGRGSGYINGNLSYGRKLPSHLKAASNMARIQHNKVYSIF